MTLEVDKYVSHDKLMVDCFEGESGFLYFSRQLIKLTDRELNLSEGRFAAYNASIDTNPMGFSTNSLDLSFQHCLMWLYDNVDNYWNFIVTINPCSSGEKYDSSRHTYKYDFFFLKPTDAVKFKLNIIYD